MEYIRKTKDIYVIQISYEGSAFEDVCEYSKEEYSNAKEDLQEYRASNTGYYRLIKRRVKI